MRDQIETIKIQTDNGAVLINKCDFDPSKHKVYEVNDHAEKKPEVQEQAPKKQAQRQTKTRAK